MTIFRKQIILSSVFSFTIIVSMIFSTWSGYRLSQIYRTMNEGTQLQVQSREIMSLMKDIVFDLFAPEEYGQLRNLTYAPRSIVTIRQWKTSADLYRQRFWLFINSPGLKNIKGSELAEQRDTAMVLNDRAMEKLDYMEQLLLKLRSLSQKNPENIYSEMQKDPELIPFFSELQKTSYYFTNSFESFMNHFQISLQNSGDRLARGTYITTLSVVIVLSLLSIIIALFISRDIILKLSRMEKAFESISRGNLSTRMDLRSNDEFGRLSERINDLMDNLQHNIDSILSMTRDVGSSISDKMDLHDILKLITKGVLHDTTAEGAAIFMSEGIGDKYVTSVKNGVLPEKFLFQYNYVALKTDIDISHGKSRMEVVEIEEYSGYVVIVPLRVHKEILGFLVVSRTINSGSFTDLGIVRLETFAEYASLSIDNYFRYREILEKQDAEYLALQAQVKPHFLYNILSSFMGLNRMGDTKGLENAITALRDMLRYLQNRSRETTVGEEIILIRRYLELQKIRFQERLSYTIDVDKSAEQIRIPRLLLQPLVENGLIHGLEPLDNGGTIEIEVKLDEINNTCPELSIKITNSGRKLHNDYSSKQGGIGLSNVKSRLGIAYPDSSFIIAAAEEGGTLVLIRIYKPKGLMT